MKMEKVYLTLLIASIVFVFFGIIHTIKKDQEKAKQKTIIYFAVFQSENGKHDRFTSYTNGEVPPKFLDWIQEKRKEVHCNYGNVAVLNCSIINQ